MSDWKETTLGGILNFRRGHDLPKSKMKKGVIPVAGSNGIIGYHNEFTTSSPGVTIGRSGNVGNAFFYNKNFWAHNTTLYIDDFKGNDEFFIYYFLKNIDFKSFNVGSAVPTLNRNHIHPLEIKCPFLPEQKVIATVLGSFDDKIDLLNCQNKTLEAIAETLFRESFVEGVQEDWEKGLLEDLFVLKRGYDLPKRKRIKGSYPIFAASGNSGGHIEFKVRGPGVSTGRSGVLGNVFYIHDDFWPLNTSLYIKEYKRSTPLFAYFFLKRIDLLNFNSGSAVPTLNRNHIHRYAVLIPPEYLIKKFDKLAQAFFQKIKINQTQIRTLENLRDTLLPKLMNGEIRVI